MKRVARFSTLAVLILLLVPAMEAADTKQADTMGVWQARRMIVEATEYIVVPAPYLVQIDRSSIRFNRDGFEFNCLDHQGGKTHFKLDLRTLEAPARDVWFWYVLLDSNGGKPLSKVEDYVKTHKVKLPKGGIPSALAGLYVSEGDAAKIFGEMRWVNPGSKVSEFVCTGDCARVRDLFIPAINRLRAFAVEQGRAVNDFPEQAAAWRALAVKPPLPDEVRKQSVLAENAVKEKQLIMAMIHYETGLKLYPTWPQGRFNAALIAAELGTYEEAIEHMQAYLDLVPGASDAEQARDQVVIWEEKAKESR